MSVRYPNSQRTYQGLRAVYKNNASLLAALPFIGATVFIAALPLLSYLLLRRRAQRAMPKVRQWMNTNSWLVNIIVYVIFILLILS